MARKPRQDDSQDFAREMADVRPLKGEPRVLPERPRPAPIPRQRLADEARVLNESLQDAEPEEGLETGEELLFLRAGYPRKLITRLRRGRFAVRDEIDLHSLNEAAAGRVLLDFIAEARRRDLGCVRVIHGKGLRSKTVPKLKALTNRLLRRHKDVVAFASCRPSEGGTGAVVVLLKMG